LSVRSYSFLYEAPIEGKGIGREPRTSPVKTVNAVTRGQVENQDRRHRPGPDNFRPGARRRQEGTLASPPGRKDRGDGLRSRRRLQCRDNQPNPSQHQQQKRISGYFTKSSNYSADSYKTLSHQTEIIRYEIPKNAILARFLVNTRAAHYARIFVFLSHGGFLEKI
jgi:hypothetical protein